MAKEKLDPGISPKLKSSNFAQLDPGLERLVTETFHAGLRVCSDMPLSTIAEVALRTQLDQPIDARGLWRTAALLIIVARAMVEAGDESV